MGYALTGAVKLVHFPFICGIPVAIMPRFDPVQFCANVERYKATVALVVPPVLVVLARHPGKSTLYFYSRNCTLFYPSR